ncbi:Conserved_hypothetical protein [Hexamita inflata]|uniref:Uncharacterized protein n=1 Tax=Hexamita inflata TaxID=28002 RepID=A0ABP1IYT8_9EUKA
MNIYELVQNLYQELCSPQDNISQNQPQSDDSHVYQQIRAVIDTASSVQSVQLQSKKQGYFRWTEALHRKFCIICAALHWDQARPKYICKFLPELSSEVVASHLQKTRNELRAFGQRGVPIPTCFQNDATFLRISEYWVQNHSRLSDSEIKVLLLQ